MKTKSIVAAAVLLFVLALGLTLYPLISNFYNARHQSQIHTAYQQQLEKTESGEIQKAKEAAQAYNAQLCTQVQGGSAFTKESLTGASQNYEDLLNLSGRGIMGYVNIPVLAVNLPIYHGTDADTLELGIGHLLGSSLPIGGESTHTVLTAHSGMASQKMFSDLNQLEKGDVFYLEVLDETLAYQVEEIHTVLPTNTDNLGITAGEERCTLVTCTPFGVNTHRLLVQGTRIPYEESEAIAAEQMQSKEVRSTWEEEYLNGIITGISVVILLAILVGTAMFFRRELE